VLIHFVISSDIFRDFDQSFLGFWSIIPVICNGATAMGDALNRSGGDGRGWIGAGVTGGALDQSDGDGCG
jgi:hypothetical protein